MFRNFLILTVRNLLKNKFQSLVSIMGLAIGFSAFIMVGLYLKYEYSWDKHNSEYDRIYRVQQKVSLTTGVEYWSNSQAALARHIRENFPEAENTVVLTDASGEFLSSSHVQTFFENEGYYAEQSVFSIFTYEFVSGNKATSLIDPYSIVLSDKLANKLFPDENALGKNVLLEKKYNLKVTGIYKELPFNSSVRPSYIIPIILYEKTNNWKNALNNWTGSSFDTYVLMKKGIPAKTLEDKIARLLDRNEVLKKQHTLYLLPIKDAYLRPKNQNDYMVAIFLYGLIAVFILLLASVNFVNLTTANSSTRAKEIGIKKANGSNRRTLIRQFLGESVITALLAINVAFVITKLFLPVFSRIINRQLQFSTQENFWSILMILGIAVMVGLLSGIYPAVFLSSFKTINVLKANFYTNQKGKIGLKKVLVTFQLFISVFLIIATLLITNQFHYMMKKDRGFTIHNLVYAQFKSEKENGNIREIRNRLINDPEIENVTISITVPFHGSTGRSIDWEGSNGEQTNATFNRVDENFFETFQMEIIQGRNFLADSTSKIKECIINETALKIFGWEDPIGKRLWDNQYQVVGVVKDFHHENMYDMIQPYLFVLHSGKTYGENIYSIRIKSDDNLLTRRKITELFEAYFPADAFEFWLLEDRLCRNFAYEAWNSLNRTFKLFSGLVIIISIIGLLSLISFTAKKRTKEMGVRKVFGSTPGQIYLMLAKEYVPLLLVSIILGSFAAYILYEYLPGAYKCPLQLREFVYTWLVTIVIALLTISYQAMQVAFSNTIKSLRYE
jgi:putative ABC transport system permease protein